MFWTSNLCFFFKENWICAMTRHHANTILLARNLTFDSDVKQWCHPLMIPCVVFGLNRTIERVVNLNMMTLVFFFVFFCFISFIHMHSAVVFDSLFTFSGYGNKTGWLENDQKKTFFQQKIMIFLGKYTGKKWKPRKSR